ncbi:hypothetical protein F3Y22_tig00109945pilonHSYRG00329 [Hibiscus syriacus]|uniref:Uncharacterized protein n=1 Tax=Hibiscus syriacus TaxID=106335 RepID=A0A6A3BRM9_HIBSY|nr:hypothetical protein F3Y22_tig00109945pilonHSYRG00329 [Hibiscus syriacus]
MEKVFVNCRSWFPCFISLSRSWQLGNDLQESVSHGFESLVANLGVSTGVGCQIYHPVLLKEVGAYSHSAEVLVINIMLSLVIEDPTVWVHDKRCAVVHDEEVE